MRQSLRDTERERERERLQAREPFRRHLAAAPRLRRQLARQDIYISLSLYIYIYIYVHIYIYMYMQVLLLYIYIYIYIYIPLRVPDSLRGSSVRIGTMQRSLAWPPRKDDRSRSVNKIPRRSPWSSLDLRARRIALAGLPRCRLAGGAAPEQSLSGGFLEEESEVQETRTCSYFLRVNFPRTKGSHRMCRPGILSCADSYCVNRARHFHRVCVCVINRQPIQINQFSIARSSITLLSLSLLK